MTCLETLESDYCRIEILSLHGQQIRIRQLESDYCRIEIVEAERDFDDAVVLESDYCRIEMMVSGPLSVSLLR